MTAFHRFALVVLSCWLGGAAHAQSPLYLLHYQSPGVRDPLIAQRALVADLGCRGVARLSAAQLAQVGSQAALLPLPEPAPGQRYAALFARDGVLPDARGLAVVVDDGELLVVAGDEASLRAARQPGVFAGGVQLLDLDTAYVPASFTAPVGVDAADPRIAALVAQVSTANMNAHIAALSAILTRRADQTQNAQAVTYLQTQLAAIPGVTVSVQNFRAGYGPNVIAELPGQELPDEIVLVGAHFDSYAGSGQARAPGADDNASGTATVLEIARLLAPLPLRRTVRFCWWNAEEFGLYGSDAYARAMRAANANLVAYLNADMNAYRANGDARDLDFILNNSSTALIQYLTTVSQTYVPTLPVVTGSLGGGSSDHASFFAQGYPAVFYFEDASQYSPFIHSANDTQAQSTNDMTLATLITQSMLAGMGELAQPLDVPAFTLDVSSGPTVGGTAVTATGTDLGSVADVLVGGVSVPFAFAGGSIAFATPVVRDAGPAAVELHNAAGLGNATFSFAVTTPPTLRLPATLQLGQGCTAAVGATPSWLALALASAVPGITATPFGNLGIGGGDLGNVTALAFLTLSSSGGTATFGLAAPNLPALSGLSLGFQVLVFDASLQSLATTNAASLTLQ